MEQSGQNAGTPATDAEQWSSDDTERSTDDPGHDGYVPLPHYQALGGDDDADDHERDGGGWDGGGDNSKVGGDGRGHEVQEGDLAALVLSAMDAEYQACLASECVTSNGPVKRATVIAPDTADSSGHLEDNNGHDRQDERLSERVPRDVAEGRQGSAEGEHANGEAVTSPGRPQPRPVSPLGRDRAERVMRAMQGFAISAPSLPPPRFEADWGSANALSNLAPRGADGERKDEVSG